MEQLEESIKYLVDIGLLIRFDENLELYHGRTRMANESSEWQVVSNYNNAGNATNNRNINNISTLYTSDKATAERFARARSQRNGGSPELHRIVSSDKNALIFNRYFNMNKLTPVQQKQVRQAMKNMQHYSLSSSIEIKFEHRDVCLTVGEFINQYTSQNNISIIDGDCLEDIYNQLKDHISAPRLRSLVLDMVGAVNARFLVTNYPQIAVKHFSENKDSFLVQGSSTPAPINRDYLASWLSNNHIVGEMVAIKSATLKDNVYSYSLFDTEKINTQKAMGDRYMAILNKFGRVGETVKNVSDDKVVMDAFSNDSPKDVVDFIRNLPGFNDLLESKAGVWEGFTVAEHTETVLRTFEKSFANDVPETLLPFMRLAILSHDLGKGWARSHSMDEKKYTEFVCDNLYQRLRVPSYMQKMLQFMIGESQRYTTDMFVKKEKYASIRLSQRCADIMRDVYQQEPPQDIVEGFASMCKMLQTCDSAAYTRYATTRDSKTGIYYRNANDRFTESFSTPLDLTREKVRFKDADDFMI